MPTPSKPESSTSASRLSRVRYLCAGSAAPLLALGCASSGQPAPTPAWPTAAPEMSAHSGAPGKAGVGVTANCQAWSTRMAGPYRYNNNQWGSDKSKAKAEQCLLTRDAGGHPELGWTWNWPGFDASVFAYPEIEFGWKPWSGGKTTDARFPMRVSDVHHLALRYEVETDADGSYDLAPEIWLTNSGAATNDPNPKSITTEVMFWMDYASGARPAGDIVETPTLDGVSYELWKADSIGKSANGKGWKLLSFKSPTIQRKGTISIDTLLRHLVETKLVNPSDYLASVEFGNEVMGGAGTTWVKRFEVDVSDAK